MKTTGPATRLQPGFVSKSAYISGLQCHKLLWHSVHAPAQIPPPDAQAAAREVTRTQRVVLLHRLVFEFH